MNTLKTIIAFGLLHFFSFILVIIFVDVARSYTPITDILTEQQAILPAATVKPEVSLVPKNNTPNFLSKANPTPQQNPPQSPQVPPEPIQSNRCLIVIDGARYDVTEFRNAHSGGNIFQCNTDMTAIFYGQHNSETLNKMQVYRSP